MNEHTLTTSNELKQQGEKSKPYFFIGDSNFSVYEEMAAQLRQIGWGEARSKGLIVKCDLILGDRFNIPYSLLRCERLISTSHYGGYRWINYFRGSHRLTLKASMARLLQESDSTCEEWMPLSFILGGDQRKRRDDRESLLNRIAKQPLDIWIIKPSSGSKGKDIVLIHSISEMENFVRALDPSNRSIFVVQRYVDRPLLHHGRKFDIRVWVLLKSPYDIFVFSQGSCRTSSEIYDRDNSGNILAHLTNHCLQEGASQFGQFENGNELWLSDLKNYLHQVFKGEDVLEKKILPGIANIIVRTLLAMKVELELLPDEPYKCFQLFGYDLIIDEQLNVYLLEINGSPGVATRFLQPVVREVLEILNSDSIFDAPRSWGLGDDGDAVYFVKLWGEGDPLPDGAARP